MILARVRISLLCCRFATFYAKLSHMRVFLIFLLSFALAYGAAAQIPQVFPHPSQRTSQRTPSRDGSLMRPGDRSYEDAMEFACWLNEKGVKFLSLHRSKLEGLFPGIYKAAFFRTEKGVVEVIFLPDPRGAESVKVKEQRTEGRYLYSFSGDPNVELAGAVDSSRPMYFLMHRNWFIVPDKAELYQALKRALKKE